MRRLFILMATAVLLMGGVAAAKTCKDYRTCREAVVAWCKGEHPRADGDKDGIPCENVCKSLDEVNKIRKEIGCK